MDNSPLRAHWWLLLPMTWFMSIYDDLSLINDVWWMMADAVVDADADANIDADNDAEANEQMSRWADKLMLMLMLRSRWADEQMKRWENEQMSRWADNQMDSWAEELMLMQMLMKSINISIISISNIPDMVPPTRPWACVNNCYQDGHRKTCWKQCSRCGGNLRQSGHLLSDFIGW